MVHESHSPLRDSVSFDRGAERLHTALRADCRLHASFVPRLTHGLNQLLVLLSGDPPLARLLIVEPPRTPALAARARVWEQNFASLLSDAAAGAAGVKRPPFYLEPYLISGLSVLLRRAWVRDDGVLDPALLGELLEFLLPYYLDPPAVTQSLASLRERRSRAISP